MKPIPEGSSISPSFKVFLCRLDLKVHFIKSMSVYLQSSKCSLSLLSVCHLYMKALYHLLLGFVLWSLESPSEEE